MERFHNRYNQYVVHFKSNKPLTVYAKSFFNNEVNGENIIRFIDTHNLTDIAYLNANEVLYIEVARYMVALEDCYE